MSGAVLKLLGAAILLLSAAAWGRGLCAHRRAITAQTEGFLTLFRALRSGISYYRAPVGDILARADAGVLSACSGRGEAVRGESLSELNETCVFLSQDLALLMAQAAGEIGRGYRDEQLAVCDRYLEALETLHREAAEKEREQSGLVTTLVIIAAAAVVILLI